MRKPVLYGGIAAGVVVLGALAFAALAIRPAVAEAEPPAQGAFPAEQIERGRVLSAAGNCTSCHTTADGAPYAGGLPVSSDFGIIYATNITPDPETGIGRWSRDAFARAMRDGVRRDGAHLFPAFPYIQFSRLTDADIDALYAYLMTEVEPVSYTPPANTLGWPFSMRGLQGGWKLMFFRGGEFQPDPEKSAEWNRGAYLAEGIGHCSACHTPRNMLGAERGGGAAYAGATVGEWYAPAINENPDAALPWTRDDLYAFLRTGASPLHGVAAGSMSEVIHAGLRELPDSDIDALAVYFADLAGSPEAHDTSAIPALLNPPESDLTAEQQRGGAKFRAFCVSCHFTPPESPQSTRPALAVNSAVTGPDSTIFVRVVLDGIGVNEGNIGWEMPGLRDVLTDQDVADIASYLRAVYGPARQAAVSPDLVARERVRTPASH